MTQIYVSGLCIIGSDKGLVPVKRQTIISTKAVYLLIGPPWTISWNLESKYNYFHTRIWMPKRGPHNDSYFVSALLCKKWRLSFSVRTTICCPRPAFHDDVIKWKHFPRYWPLLRGIHRSPVNSPHKGQRRGALMFSLICLKKQLSKQSRRWWFETLSRPLWRRCNVFRLYQNGTTQTHSHAYKFALVFTIFCATE